MHGETVEMNLESDFRQRALSADVSSIKDNEGEVKSQTLILNNDKLCVRKVDSLAGPGSLGGEPGWRLPAQGWCGRFVA